MRVPFVGPGRVEADGIFVVMILAKLIGVPAATVHQVARVHPAGVEGIEEYHAVHRDADGAHVQCAIVSAPGESEMVRVHFRNERNVEGFILLPNAVGIAKSAFGKPACRVVWQAVGVEDHAAVVEAHGDVIGDDSIGGHGIAGEVLVARAQRCGHVIEEREFALSVWAVAVQEALGVRVVEDRGRGGFSRLCRVEPASAEGDEAGCLPGG